MYMCMYMITSNFYLVMGRQTSMCIVQWQSPLLELTVDELNQLPFGFTKVVTAA